MTENKLTNVTPSIAQLVKIDDIYFRISEYVQAAQNKVMQAINTEMVRVYWKIGREIVEQEQQGKERADYGKELISTLSQKLMQKFGKGYSVSNLRNMRQFYLNYHDQIHQTPSGEFIFEPKISWSKYCILIK
jgi:hypothetical protein